MSLARPKSQIFTIFPCARRTFRAARSRWTHCVGREETTDTVHRPPDNVTPARLATSWWSLELPGTPQGDCPGAKSSPPPGSHLSHSHEGECCGAVRCLMIPDSPLRFGEKEGKSSHCYKPLPDHPRSPHSDPVAWVYRGLCFRNTLTFLEAKNSIPRAT